MGMFGKKNPYAELSRISNLQIMHSTIDANTKPFLLFPYLLSAKSNAEVEVFELDLANLSQDFRDFSFQLLTQYKSLYPVGSESPRPGGDEFALTAWPNFSILNDDNPFRIMQDSNFQDRKGDTETENFTRKEFSFLVFIDSASVGKLQILKKVGTQSTFKEIFDLRVKAESTIGFILSNLCSKDHEIKSSLIVRAKFHAGNFELDKLLITIPRATEAAKISQYLSKVNFD